MKSDKTRRIWEGDKTPGPSREKARTPRWLRHLRMLFWGAQLAVVPATKRALDILGAGAGIVVLSPVLLGTWLAIRLQDGGPALFWQQRIGLDGEPFQIIKFRSMVLNAAAMKESLLARNESADGVLFKLRDDPRITPVGRIIRRFSIDELPQLFNVLRGEMSLVGPRPALPDEVAQYRTTDRARLRVKPGITCLWQVGGRSRIGFDGQVNLDLQYIRNWSLAADMKILLRTLPAVVAGEGAY